MELKILGGSFTKPGNTTISMDCRFIIPLSIMKWTCKNTDWKELTEKTFPGWKGTSGIKVKLKNCSCFITEGTKGNDLRTLIIWIERLSWENETIHYNLKVLVESTCSLIGKAVFKGSGLKQRLVCMLEQGMLQRKHSTAELFGGSFWHKTKRLKCHLT